MSILHFAGPFVLGIKPIPDIQEKIQKMIAKYRDLSGGYVIRC